MTAATICVQANDVAGLQSALATAATDGEDDLIQLQTGQYDMPSNFLLEYYPNSEQHDLTIEGGYSDFFGNPCGLAPVAPDARQTVLNGGQLVLTMPDGSGSLTLKGITISGMLSSNQQSVPVSVGGLANSTGNVSVYNVMFLGNVSTANVAVFLSAVGGAVQVQNSYFYQNASFATGMSAIYISDYRTDGSFCQLVLDSTFTQNASANPAVQIQSAACKSLIANDIFWGGTGGDIYLPYQTTVLLANDDLEDPTETGIAQVSALYSVYPAFSADGSLQDASPLRDAGSSGGFIFSPGEFDVIGNPRVYGATPDIGAFEIQDVIFAASFEPIH